MKRLLAAAILLVTVISVYLYSYFYINKTCDTAKKLLDECTAAYNNGTDAEAKAKKLEKYWTDKEKPLSVITNHESIDEIERAISTLLIYSATEEKEIFNEYSGTVSTLLHQLIEDTVPSVHSIM